MGVLRRRLLGGYAFTAEALSYFSAMSSAGYNATDAEKVAADKFIRSTRAAGIWDKFDRCYLHIGNLAAQLICCKSLTSRVAVNSPTASSNGLSYNGTNSYTKSDVNVSALTNLTSTSSHCFSYFSASAVPANTVIGATQSSDGFYLHGGILA